jgi:dynein heavy chain
MCIVFCQSPSGDTFRIRARRFPALINCMTIDWFHAWPDDALYSVAKSFLNDVDVGENDPEVIVQFIANAHSSVIKSSDEYLQAERRYNSATPKSYLELISLFKAMLERRRTMIINNTQHCSKGLQMLRDSSQDVEVMKGQLEKQTTIVAEKQTKCAALIERVSQDAAVVKKESEAAQREEVKTSKIKAEVEEKQAVAAEDLKKAQPLDAIECIDKKSMTELSLFASPPDRSSRSCRRPWKVAKKLMGNTDNFMNRLKHLHEAWNNDIMQMTKQCVAKWTFKGTDVPKSSSTCFNISTWFPKEHAAKEADEMLAESEEKLRKVQARAKALEDQLQQLKDSLETQQQAKNEAEGECQRMSDQITCATDLVAGLGDEGQCWGIKIEEYKVEAMFFSRWPSYRTRGRLRDPSASVSSTRRGSRSWRRGRRRSRKTRSTSSATTR